MPLPSTAGLRSSFPDSVRRTTTNISLYFRTRNGSGSRQWRPPALHPATLAFAIAVPLALIITLVLLLRRSQRDNGIIFAPDINDLPLSRTFMYQYFPTILAVVFSIFWAWIDLEVKRLEPYYRLSTDEGALGKDSLLLAYPFGFVPLVPVKAFRQRHWPVFWAGLALLLVTWGLVPTQAGIFSTDHITRNVTETFEVSTGYMPPNEQKHSLSMGFALSAYGIVVLNETIPPYMARNYTLAPFRPSAIERQGPKDVETQEWTAPTTLYSLDMHCEPAIQVDDSGTWNNSGCAVVGLQMGNDTISTTSSVASSIKPFSAQYIGFWNLYGYANYYLSSDCPTEKNHTFFAAFTRNKKKESDPAHNVTAIFCEPTYYSQLVNATVQKSSNRPIRIVPLEQKQPLNDTHAILNTTVLEMLFSGGYPQTRTRLDELPNHKIPSLGAQLAETNVSFADDREPLVGFSVLMDQVAPEDLLDWKILARSYADSYRLMFARAMVDVLDDGFNTTKTVTGTRRFETNAVGLEPVFTFIVIGFLGLIALSTAVLLCLSRSRNLSLRSDPSTIGSVMTLVTNSGTLLQDFQDLDCCTADEIKQAVRQKRYKLIEHDNQIKLIERQTVTATSRHVTVPAMATSRTVSTKTIEKPVRPMEFSVWMSIMFITIFMLLAIFLATVFVKARSNGLQLPSQNKFVQNLLENYIPTAIATLIEPLWVLLNRLLCLLQPIQELQDCKAKAQDSVDLNYNSLPPQLVLFKALRARHFVLAAVCSMALLANVLSIAFAGLFNHDVAEVFKPKIFESPFDLRFVPINGTVGPTALRSTGGVGTRSGAYLGGDGQDQFYIRNSNLSRQTPLPPWTDEKTFYLPFMTADNSNDTIDSRFQSETPTVSAKLECENVDPKSIHFSAYTLEPILNTTVPRGDIQVQCSGSQNIRVASGPGLDDTTFDTLCQSGATALELVLTLDALGVNATEEDKKLCRQTVLLGWVRSPKGTCDSFSYTPTVNADNSVFIQCRPQLMRGLASVQVDSQGRLAKPSHTITPAKDLEPSESETMFEHGPEDLIAQSNLYIFQTSAPPWHNDTIASDYFNYFVRKEANNNSFLDPKKAVPSFEELHEPLQKAYASLFALWLGGNKEHLLIQRSKSDFTSVKGWRVANEERLFLSTPLSSIALGILCTYALVACVVYLRRPAKNLARLPTNLASIIALFAGSTAVQEMGGMSGLSKKGRANSFAKLGFRYGYGSYVGTDGRVHIGIEKTPFVRPWKRSLDS